MLFDLKAIAADVKPLILQAGEMILSAWDEHTISAHLKDERDIVTDTDVEVEKYLRKYLYNILPQAGFIVEEGKSEMLGEYNWAIDPIDGTKYFAAQVPLCFTQVALLKNNEPVISFIYNPFSKQLFHAIQGQGAYLNDVRLAKQPSAPLKSAILHFDFGPTSGKENAWKFELFKKMSEVCYRVRITAGYLAPYLPLGAIDISINTDIKSPPSLKNITDLAPHKLLLSEAGYQEEILKIDGHSVLIWAAEEHIKELKSLIK
jgi:myo-inositol-1(or 4)-monophosphatase